MTRLSAALTALQLVIFVTLVILAIWTYEERFAGTAILSFFLLVVQGFVTFALALYYPNKREGTK